MKRPETRVMERLMSDERSGERERGKFSLAMNLRTLLKCHKSLNFNRTEMIFFQNSHLRKIYQMRPSWFLYLYSFRNESQMNKTFAFCKCGWANLS